MSWTTPHTFAVGELLTASSMNTYVSNDLSWLYGRYVAHGTRTSNVTTTGTTFGAGADLLASALSFTADGTSDYTVQVGGMAIKTSAAAGQQVILNLNLDSADGGLFFEPTEPTSNYQFGLAAECVFTPSSGAHTVNVRMWSSAAGTALAYGGAGGAGVTVPILVSLWRLS